MPAVMQRPQHLEHSPAASQSVSRSTVRPSKVDPWQQPFSFEQQLEPFGSWASEPIWVPPKNSASQLADSMLGRFGCLSSKQTCWNAVVEEHREKFTQVRLFDLPKASIRLPKGKVYMTVLEKDRFDEIEDPIPASVQTRLEEFLDGKGRQPGVKVYYLKPLCVEVEDKLIFTQHADIVEAIEKIKSEVFSEYRRNYLLRRPQIAAHDALRVVTAVPRALTRMAITRRQKALDDYHAKLEFKRRKTALRAANLHRKIRTDGCTFDDMLGLTNELEQTDVIEQYAAEKELSAAARRRLLKTAAGTIPWFVALGLTASFLASLSVPVGAPLVVCDPAFVAEMPDAKGQLLKIGHFDEVAGVTHVEI
ncbi:MAG: hypothetical protein AAF394_16535 [Planctomycetota bacterium]